MLRMFGGMNKDVDKIIQEVSGKLKLQLKEQQVEVTSCSEELHRQHVASGSLLCASMVQSLSTKRLVYSCNLLVSLQLQSLFCQVFHQTYATWFVL